MRITQLADPALWSWGIAFLRNCTAQAYRENSRRLERLSLYSRNLLASAEAELGLPPDTRHDGGLYLFHDEAQFQTHAAGLHGEDRQAISRDRLLQMEPSLAGLGDRLKGAIFSKVDSMGDCHLFTRRTAEALTASNLFETRFNHRVIRLRRDGGRITAVETAKGEIGCRAVVLATGIETRHLTAPLGFKPQIYPVKGYSGTWPVRDPKGIPSLPFVDETDLLAVANYGGKLRVTAIAEFAGTDRNLPPDRTAMLASYVRRNFGDAVDHDSAVCWAGLRPTTPGGPPYLGRVRKLDNLWINAGHGQLGWTMSLGCGELIAQGIDGDDVDLRDVSERAHWLAPLGTR